MRACWENLSDMPQPCYKTITCEECKKQRSEKTK